MSHMLIEISTRNVFLSVLQFAKSPFWGSKPHPKPLVCA